MDTTKFEKKYSEEGFWDKIGNYAKKIGSIPIENAFRLYYAMTSGKATPLQITTILATLGYFISPIDVIPDFMPGGVGLLDDASVLAAAVTTLACCADPEVIKAARKKVSDIFGDMEIWWKRLFFAKDTNMAVLGMDQSGKTSFYNFLQFGEPRLPDGTPVEESHNEFKIYDSNNYALTIKEGKDISGRAEHVFKFYPKMIKENDLILFFFNSSKFFEDEAYRQDVIDRIALVYEFSESSEDKKIFIVPTFKDIIEENNISETQVKELILSSLQKDKSARHFSDSQYLLPLYQTNDKESLTELRDTIFNVFRV